MLTKSSHVQWNLLKRAVGIYQQSRAYNWGIYDASSGKCCHMRDADTTKCAGQKQVCKRMTPLPNRCYKRNENIFDLEKEYPKFLMEIYERRQGNMNCDLMRYDKCYYQPSDKNRRYQRTWPECPLIWLRPKQTCCYDREYYPPMKRRQRPPSGPPLTAIEKHHHAMRLLCASYLTWPGCKTGRKPPKCLKGRRPTVCQKELAPYPSFSECNKQCMTRVCPLQCTCRIFPNMCDVWSAYHHNRGKLKSCTQALVSFCPFKTRIRYP
ncbi:uncharacterized protein Dwil_GK15759 [Drosophila willistoni]|uniref:Uncharacterized protein n=1 Tax=Drosophila willistoni TaxID=7260 RepID=B4MRG9_DROWI|nr:uncharacterized protein LOC6640781 [Drosophila willistoni]EDW74708.1 uncharacterized protein Dwil_GK15759 [Drosophila willistoni]